jgi:hypothetical protein
LSLSDRRQDSYWSIVSELLSLIERTRKHRQASDLAKQIEGLQIPLSASSTTGFPKNSRKRRRERLQSASSQGAVFFLLEAR